MDHFEKLRSQLRRYLFLLLLFNNAIIVEVWWANHQYWHLSALTLLPVLAGIGLLLPLLFVRSSIDYLLTPLKATWQAVMHIAPGDRPVAAPKIESLKVGQELVASLTAQVYQFATQAEHPGGNAQTASDQANFIANNLPLPFLILDAEQTIVTANDTASKYLGLAHDELVGNNLYSVLDMSFPSNNTFDHWLEKVRAQSAVASESWERVRRNMTEGNPPQLFDLAAYYNQGNATGLETILVLFDHTEQYSQDDQAVGFIALSVHELRTPLTLLRGYIEVFEEELGGQLSPELTDFMHKMHASAEQLTAFVGNILNVARVDEDQLTLGLREEQWPAIVQRAVDTMSLRAQVRGITLECHVDDNLPTVGVDRVSIQEVIDNLIDNAIKYSGHNKQIKINSNLTKDGLVETTVQDGGVGIPANIIPNLFNKFYRDHRNRAQIGGTGLGLYLCKAIVTAHGGQVWVKSKEGQGSTFGFTVMPYAALSVEQKAGSKTGITRSAHGWIKNHSLYRR